jgi:hypothetical protein
MGELDGALPTFSLRDDATPRKNRFFFFFFFPLS